MAGLALILLFVRHAIAAQFGLSVAKYEEESAVGCARRTCGGWLQSALLAASCFYSCTIAQETRHIVDREASLPTHTP